LEMLPGATGTSSVSQRLLGSQLQDLKGKTVTTGAWIWASAPTEASLPILSDGNQIILKQVKVGVSPAFYASRGTISKDAGSIQVILQAMPAQAQNEAITIYYDGIILLKGEWPLDSVPVFEDPQAEKGNWGNLPFRNMVRNASAEWSSPYVRPWVELLSKRFPWSAHLSPTLFVNALLDPQNSSWVYRATASSLFHTFWGDFAWESIRLPAICYAILKWVSVLTILSSTIALWKIGSLKPVSLRLALVWMGLAMLLIWLSVFIRGLPSLFGQIYIPSARYGFPAIIPTMIFLSGGWFVWLHRQSWLKLSIYLFLVGFVIIDIVSFITIIHFYQAL